MHIAVLAPRLLVVVSRCDHMSDSGVTSSYSCLQCEAPAKNVYIAVLTLHIMVVPRAAGVGSELLFLELEWLGLVVRNGMLISEVKVLHALCL